MLLDTSVLIWYGLEPERLSKHAARLVSEGRNSYSHVSLWEMAIKNRTGKLRLRSLGNHTLSARQYVLDLTTELQLSALPIEFDDVADVELLPLHHRDLFDRLLVVQAKRHNLPIVSPDPIFQRYGVRRVW